MMPGSIDYDSLKHMLAPRRREAHKGDFGHVLVVGGDQGFGGAALMAAEAAARTGAGLVSAATHPTHAGNFLVRRPEIMTRGIDDEAALAPLLERATTIVLGPGLGQSDWSRMNMRVVLQNRSAREVPLVVDADALNLIGQGQFNDYLDPPPPWILTPHPGEAARLLGVTPAVIQDDRAAAAGKLQARYGGVVVLKGAGSLVCYPRGQRQTTDGCRDGNPGMASGGMGDILSGVLGGLLAQHYSPGEAARLGVCLHARAADHAAGAGERGLLATDLLPWLHSLANPEPVQAPR